MAANQVQIRRDTNTNLVAATPAAGELAYDTTNKRVTAGDGSTAGGTVLPNHIDLQNQVLNSATSSGTDTITLTLPTHGKPTAYANRQRFAFIAGGTNTGVATININALGAKTIKKVEAGALSDLAAGDITSGRPYDIMYDNTYFVLMNSAGVPDSSVTNAKLADAAAGDYIVSALTNAEDRVSSASYKKHLEIIAPRDGTYRVRMAVYNPSGTASARIYVDGTAAGVEKTGIGASIWYQNDDLTVTAGQLIQLYIKRTSGSGDYGTLQLAVMEGAPLNAGRLYTTENAWQ